jgi:hypothetical protein
MASLHSRYSGGAGKVTAGDEDSDPPATTPKSAPYQTRRHYRRVETSYYRLVHRQRAECDTAVSEKRAVEPGEALLAAPGNLSDNRRCDGEPGRDE